MRFSLVIPAYNEEAYLPQLFETVDAARTRYRGGVDAIEVIVSDNASTDRTAAIAAERGCRVVRVEKRMIAAARNGGGRAARGEIVCFVDADMRIHPETFNEIDRVLRTRRVIGGATGAWPDRWSPGIALAVAGLLFVAMLLRLVRLDIDSGVVFCRREDFLAVGGYREDRLFAEDVAFLVDLWRLGRSRGQQLTRVTTVRATASTRKFDKYGDWHFFTLPFYVIAEMLRGSTSWARKYWYEDR